MRFDYHIHSEFSHDSKQNIIKLIETAIKKEISEICITDHLDIDFPNNQIKNTLNVEEYLKKIKTLKEEYKDQIDIKFGIELGIQPHLENNEELLNLLKDPRFDFIIGSGHATTYKNINSSEFFNSYETKDEAHNAYFQDIYKWLRWVEGISVIGHLDFIRRYGKEFHQDYKVINYEYHRDILTKIINLAISKNIGLEINTSGFRYGLGESTPGIYIFQLYKELGGKIISIGSDSHNAEDLCSGFEEGVELLKKCGFKEVSLFHKKEAKFITI